MQWLLPELPSANIILTLLDTVRSDLHILSSYLTQKIRTILNLLINLTSKESYQKQCTIVEGQEHGLITD